MDNTYTNAIIKDLEAVQSSGAFSVVIEAVTEQLANKLCKLSKTYQ